MGKGNRNDQTIPMTRRTGVKNAGPFLCIVPILQILVHIFHISGIITVQLQKTNSKKRICERRQRIREQRPHNEATKTSAMTI